MKQETREQFEQNYGIEEFEKRMVSMRCSCLAAGGPTHWAAIRNTPDAIEEHLNNEECLDDLRDREGI